MWGTPFVATRPGPLDSCSTVSPFGGNTSECWDGAYPHRQGEPASRVAPGKMQDSRLPWFFLRLAARWSPKWNSRNARKRRESTKCEVHEMPPRKRTLCEPRDLFEDGLRSARRLPRSSNRSSRRSVRDPRERCLYASFRSGRRLWG